MPKAIKAFVLKAIAAYRSDAWIVRELKKRYNLERSETTIRTQYRYNKAYEAEIQSYKQSYESNIGEGALCSKRYILDLLHESVEQAFEQKDYKGVAALIKQAVSITGMGSDTDMETGFSSDGYSYEDALKAILDKS